MSDVRTLIGRAKELPFYSKDGAGLSKEFYDWWVRDELPHLVSALEKTIEGLSFYADKTAGGAIALDAGHKARTILKELEGE